MRKPKGLTQINLYGGNILCSVETTHAGGSSSLFSYSAAVAADVVHLQIRLIAAAVADATTITTVVAAAKSIF